MMLDQPDEEEDEKPKSASESKREGTEEWKKTDLRTWVGIFENKFRKPMETQLRAEKGALRKKEAMNSLEF